jgi:hypothetical protein
MAKRLQDQQHEILTPEIVQRLREATQKNYDEWRANKFGHLDLTAWDRYLTWLMATLPKTRRVWSAIYE